MPSFNEFIPTDYAMDGSCKERLSRYRPVSYLGKGSFARVLFVQKKTDGGLCAMKVLDKKAVISERKGRNIVREKSIMSKMDSPFIVKITTAFQSSKQIFLVLSCCAGGDIGGLIRKDGPLNPDAVAFYAAEISLALEYLHSRTVLFRDMKADNVLLDGLGNIKLSDFGLAMEGITSWSEGASTVCGTPLYMAPETFLNGRYGFAADWWSVGIVTYQMLSGTCPYRGKRSQEIFEKVTKNPLLLLRTWAPEIRSLLSALLTKRHWLRIGATHGASEILAHEAFRDLNMGDIRTGLVPGPIRRTILPSVPPLPEQNNPLYSTDCEDTVSVSSITSGAGKKSLFSRIGRGMLKRTRKTNLSVVPSDDDVSLDDFKRLRGCRSGSSVLKSQQLVEPPPPAMTEEEEDLWKELGVKIVSQCLTPVNEENLSTTKKITSLSGGLSGLSSGGGAGGGAPHSGTALSGQHFSSRSLRRFGANYDGDLRIGEDCMEVIEMDECEIWQHFEGFSMSASQSSGKMTSNDLDGGQCGVYFKEFSFEEVEGGEGQENAEDRTADQDLGHGYGHGHGQPHRGLDQGFVQGLGQDLGREAAARAGAGVGPERERQPHQH